MQIYVSNLGKNITDESLRAVFATYGEVSSSRVVKDPASGDSQGCAMVEMPDRNQAEKAIARIHGAVLNGMNVAVRQADPLVDTVTDRNRH